MIGMASSKGHRARLDHGEREGWGISLPASVFEDPVWRARWSGVESLTVTVSKDSIVVQPAEARPPMRPQETVRGVVDSAGPGREVGRLRWFDEERDYGFIERPFGGDLFFRRSGLACDPSELEPGLPLDFEERPGKRGPVAVGVKPLRLPAG